MALPADEPRRHDVRRLWPSDREVVLGYFLRLDPETRANRFMGQVSEAGVRAYAEGAVSAEGVIYGVFADGALRGLGELRPTRPASTALMLGPRAEAAFAVEAAYRRRGIGGALFRRIARAARHRGVVDLEVRCLARNSPMLRLAARQGADLRVSSGETEGLLHLPRPTPASLWYEAIAEGVDFTRAVVQPHERILAKRSA